MTQLRSIEIDFDVHKRIEAERRGFDEPPNAALRRLLGLGDAITSTPAQSAEVGEPWKEDGVVVPHGSLVRMIYGRGRQVYEGRITNGRWLIKGRAFDSPSGAASELAVTKEGSKTKLNGWNYWEVKFPGESKWVRLGVLRSQARKTLDQLLEGFR